MGGCAARLWLWWISLGTNDLFAWFKFGESIAANGLAATYANIQDFNHPPLMGLYAMQMWWWSGDDPWTFAHLMKLPGLAGEAIILWALWRFAGPKAAAAYAWLPSAILLSGFHCNTDCFYVAFVLVAVIAFDRQFYFLAGLLLAASLNVKLIPLALLPMVLIAAPNWKALLRLTAGLAIGVAPFVAPALTAGPAMYRNMVAYNSTPDSWGLLALFNHSARIPGLATVGPALRGVYEVIGRYVVLASITAVALLSKFRGCRPLAGQAALGAALFLILTPGFGVQYVIFAAPLLCLVDVAEGLRWGWFSGWFIALVYWGFRIHAEHLLSLFHTDYPFPSWVFGLAAWAVLAHFAWGRISALVREKVDA